MSKIDFGLDFSGMTSGSEAYSIMDGDLGTTTPEVEAEVKINVSSAEDAQVEEVADETVEDVDTTADTAAELFTSMQEMIGLRTVLAGKESISPDLYEFINNNGKLGTYLGNITLPAYESYRNNPNQKILDVLMPALDKTIDDRTDKNSYAGGLASVLSILAKKIADMDKSTLELVTLRKQRISRLIAKMEQDEAPEEATVTTTDEGGTDSAPESSEENKEDKKEESSEETKSEEKEESTSEEKSEDTTSADVNTAEECIALMNVLDVENLANSPMMTKIESAMNGDYDSLMAIRTMSDNVGKTLYQYRKSGAQRRKITLKKDELLNALKMYQNILNNWESISKLNYGTSKIAGVLHQTVIKDKETLSSAGKMYYSLVYAKNYVRNTNKAMNNLYHNLWYSTAKLLAAKHK